AQSIAERVVRLCGREDLIDEPWFKNHKGRLEHVDELDEIIQGWVGERTTEEVLEAFAEYEGAIAPIYSIEDIVKDPQYLAREMQSIESRWGADTEQLCREKGFGTRIGWGEWPALIVIDMARAFCDPSYKVGCDQTATLEAISQLLAAARAAELPVYYTTIAYLPDGHDGGMFVQKIPPLLELQLDDPGSTEIDPRIAPAEGEVIVEKK